jgi:putative hemolysin
MQTVLTESFKLRPSFVTKIRETNAPRFSLENIPKTEIADGRYITRFARTVEEIDAALRLRFEVFNLELNEGLESSFIFGRDEDKFDATCQHLIVTDRFSNEVIGTYRVRTWETAQTPFGFYSSNEFTLEDLPSRMLTESMEIGRACIAREHRNSRVLFLLWKGLAMYAAAKGKRYFFGCCSLTSQDCAEGKRGFQQLARDGHFHPNLRVSPREEFSCQTENSIAEINEEIKLPKLFETYLRIGAKVCSEPAIDREFKTIDFLVIIDTRSLSKKYYKMFFA